jgi:hypothetical protein
MMAGSGGGEDKGGRRRTWITGTRMGRGVLGTGRLRHWERLQEGEPRGTIITRRQVQCQKKTTRQKVEISPKPGTAAPPTDLSIFQQTPLNSFSFQKIWGRRGTNIMGFFGRYALLVLPPGPARQNTVLTFVCLLLFFFLPPWHFQC